MCLSGVWIMHNKNAAPWCKDSSISQLLSTWVKWEAQRTREIEWKIKSIWNKDIQTWEYRLLEKYICLKSLLLLFKGIISSNTHSLSLLGM